MLRPRSKATGGAFEDAPPARAHRPTVGPAHSELQGIGTNRLMNDSLAMRGPLRWTLLFGALVALIGGCAPRDDDPLAAIRQLHDEGRYAESLERLEPLVEVEPHHPAADLLYGKALVETREFNLALDPLRRAAAAPEYTVEAGVLLATALLRGGMAAEAVAEADRILEIDPDDASAWNLRARGNLVMGRLRRALADIERALELEPDRMVYHISHAFVLLALQRFDEAAMALEVAVERSQELKQLPDRIAANLCVAEARLEVVRRGEATAMQSFSACVERFPANPSVVRESVEFYDAVGDVERGNEILHGAIEAWPQHSPFLRNLAARLREQDRGAEIERFLEQKIESEPSIALWTVYAEHRLIEGDFAGAARAYGEALEVSRRPGSAAERSLRFAYADALIQSHALEEARGQIDLIDEPAYADLLRGRVLLIEGDPKGALEALERGIHVWPKNATARYLAAQAAERLGDFERAAREYQASVSAGADRTRAGLALASLYEAQGKYVPALETVMSYTKLHSADPDGFVLGMRVAHHLARGKRRAMMTRRLAAVPGQRARAVGERARLVAVDKGPAAAVEVIESGDLDLTDPAHVFALGVLVDQLAAQGAHDRALARVDVALAVHPERAAFHTLRGEVLARMGRANAAHAAFTRAVELDVRDAAALAGLAQIAAASDAPGDAIALYDRAAEADPEDPSAAYAAARMLLESERAGEAESRLERLLYAHPRHTGAAQDLAALLLARHGDLDRALGLAQRAVLFGAGSGAQETLDSIRLERAATGASAS